MFDSYSFEAETARRSFSCPTRYPVNWGDQLSLVFPSHLNEPCCVMATLPVVNFPSGESRSENFPMTHQHCVKPVW